MADTKIVGGKGFGRAEASIIVLRLSQFRSTWYTSYVSPYDDGWLLDLLAFEIRPNDPRAISVREAIKHAAQPDELEGRLSALAASDEDAGRPPCLGPGRKLAIDATFG